MPGAIHGQMVLKDIIKQGEQTIKRKPASSTPPWPLLQLLLSGFCPPPALATNLLPELLVVMLSFPETQSIPRQFPSNEDCLKDDGYINVRMNEYILNILSRFDTRMNKHLVIATISNATIPQDSEFNLLLGILLFFDSSHGMILHLKSVYLDPSI